PVQKRERRPSYAYVNEIRRSGSSHEGSNPNITTGYHRSSSSSSTASSGKNLVKNKNSSNNRSQTEWNYSSRDSRYIPHHRRGNGLSSSSPSPSPEVPKKSPPKFFLGPPPSPGSSTGYHSPLRSSPSPSPSPEMPSTPTNNRVKSPHLLHPHYGVELHAGNLLSQSDKEGKINSAYDSYWHIPRASLWCRHNNCEDPDKQCPQCQAKDEISSNCSSINPPPTFTALDNYRPNLKTLYYNEITKSEKKILLYFCDITFKKSFSFFNCPMWLTITKGVAISFEERKKTRKI
ncbi:hypothetical protein Avbf_01487, partial [Armadillidium vulgare]